MKNVGISDYGYEKVDPLLMLKIGDWKQFGKDEPVCGIVVLKRSDVRLAKSLQNRGVRVGFYPAKGVRIVDFHDTPISVIADILPMKCVQNIECSGGIRLNGVCVRRGMK